MKLTLALAFIVTAAIYASVGFGGGSTYTALLAVSGTPYILIPIVSLVCNICVVSGNSFRYIRGGFVTLSKVWPLLVVSVPAAMIGGMLHVSEALFLGLLSAALFLAGIRMVFAAPLPDGAAVPALQPSAWIAGMLGGFIGFFSGIVGIGGGIFLAPFLYRLRWGGAKNIAAICSVFILFNSASGLIGQLSKKSEASYGAEIIAYWPLILAVLIGGTFGNALSIRMLKANTLRRITGSLILIVAARLLLKWIDTVF